MVSRSYERMKLPYEQRAIIESCTHPTGQWIELPRAVLEGSLPALFEDVVRRYPDRPAVKLGDDQLTYAELNCAANRVARLILARRGPLPEPVPILMTHGIGVLVAMWGVLKAGKFYVPLDLEDPAERNQAILQDLDASLILTDEVNRAAVQALADQPVILSLEQAAAIQECENPTISIASKAYAYIVYTSGSTGQPKGVIIDHEDVLHFSAVTINTARVCPEDRFALLNSFHFNGAATPLYSALLSGAALLPFDAKTEGVESLVAFLNEEQITIIFIIPSLFRQLSAVLSPSTRFEHLRYLGFGGDRVLPSDIEFVKRVCPPTCTARIGYGASEVKIISRYFFNAQSPAFSHPVPVGYAFEDTEVQILGESGEVLGYDQVGEIAVKSRYMSPGYWRRPDLTAQKFRRDPEDEAKRIYLTGDLGRLRPDGCLIHLGRKDFQVKIRGYRVEVEEIEAALLALPQIRHVAVTTHEEGDGERSLVAYLVADGSWQPRVSELRRSLQQKLPEYMLPKHYIFLDELPRAAFGKVDLRALPLPYATRPPLDAPYTAPRTPLETLVASIWQDVLGIEQIGIYDHFLELGGDSLQAMRISSKILQETQSEIPRNLLLQLSTVAEMALAVLKWYVSAVDLVPINEIGELLSALEMMPQVEANELPIEKLERRLYDNI